MFEGDIPFDVRNSQVKCLCVHLTLCILMDSSFWLDTIYLGYSFVHIQGCQVIIFQKSCILLSEDLFYPYSVDTDEMQHYCCISSRSSLFANVLVSGFPVFKGLMH